MSAIALNANPVVITGAAAGIGLECARAFARRGAKLALLDVDASGLERARIEFKQRGVDVECYICDMTDEARIKESADAIVARFGAPRVLVNNAGIGYLGAFADTPVDAWRRVFDINFFGYVHATRAFLPWMRGAEGTRTVVNVASSLGFAPSPSLSAYCASKHAVVGLSEVLALELAETNVSVLIVAPGIINTNIVRNRSNVAATISDAQLEKLQHYYATKGCLPDVIGEGIARAVESGKQLLAIGPSAKVMTGLMRVSRRLTRRLVSALSKQIGFA